MIRKLAKLVVAIGVVAMAIPSFAAVENVKVGGDIDVKMIYRDSFDFNALGLDENTFTYIGTRVYIAAELTDNVSAMIRLINERDFGNDYLREVEGSLVVDLAYVKLADLLTPGLDLIVGRQEIQLGEGLVVGSRYRAIDYLLADLGTAALDLGQQKAFDAVRVNYAIPATNISLTGFKAKIAESYGLTPLGILTGLGSPIGEIGDADLYGLGLTYDNGVFCIDPYFVYTIMADGTNDLDLMTGGVRAGYTPMENLNLKLELAKQFGDTDFGGGVDFEGWAGLFGVSYTFNTSMQPTITAGYSYFSGQDAAATDLEAWIPVFPANIASRVGKIAYPLLFPAGEGIMMNPLCGTGSGLQVINLGFGLKPTEKLTIGLDLFNLTADESGAASDDYGNEIDLSLTYAYTEDVSFGIDLGTLLTGDNIEDTLGAGVDVEDPWQAIVSMKVVF